MERDASTGQPTEAGQPSEPQQDRADSDGLLDRLSIIETQPLSERARGFEQLHDELLQELQRSDNDAA